MYTLVPKKELSRSKKKVGPNQRYQKKPFIELNNLRGIKKQIEYYFSDENLKKDFYFKSKMGKFGFVSVNVIMGFRRIKAAGIPAEYILKSAENAELISVRGNFLRSENWWKYVNPPLEIKPEASDENSKPANFDEEKPESFDKKKLDDIPSDEELNFNPTKPNYNRNPQNIPANYYNYYSPYSGYPPVSPYMSPQELQMINEMGAMSVSQSPYAGQSLMNSPATILNPNNLVGQFAGYSIVKHQQTAQNESRQERESQRGRRRGGYRGRGSRGRRNAKGGPKRQNNRKKAEKMKEAVALTTDESKNEDLKKEESFGKAEATSEASNDVFEFSDNGSSGENKPVLKSEEKSEKIEESETKRESKNEELENLKDDFEKDNIEKLEENSAESTNEGN